MKKALILSLVVSFVAAAGATRAAAQGTVGSKAPEIMASDWLNTPPLSLARLRGRIVVVEFWATWCPPCRKSIPHLIELHKTYAPKGVVIVGLSDEPKTKVEPFAAGLGMTYAVGCGSSSSGLYGVQGIPHAFVVDTEGKIVWGGHPMDDDFEPAIQKALKDTPPSLMTAKDKAAAGALLEKAEAAAKKEQYAVAAAMLAKLKQADEDPKIKERAAALRKTLADRAEARMAEAEKFIETKQYLEACTALGEVAALASGTDTAAKATDRLKELLKDDAIRTAVEQARRENEAAGLLADIEENAAKKAPAALLEAYDDLAKRFAGTKAGQAAADKAKAMRADPALLATMQNAAAEKDCLGWISMAKNFIKAGHGDKAAPYLEKVIGKYPDTDYAKEARQLLDTISKK